VEVNDHSPESHSYPVRRLPALQSSRLGRSRNQITIALSLRVENSITVMLSMSNASDPCYLFGDGGEIVNLDWAISEAARSSVKFLFV
jgi:hypothetical protein